MIILSRSAICWEDDADLRFSVGDWEWWRRDSAVSLPESRLLLEDRDRWLERCSLSLSEDSSLADADEEERLVFLDELEGVILYCLLDFSAEAE